MHPVSHRPFNPAPPEAPLNRGISASRVATTSRSTAAGSGIGTSYQEANAIATKDVGSLRVLLKSVLPMKLNKGNRQSRNGIKLSFEFLNRDLRVPLVVAMNTVAGYLDRTMGEVLRTRLLDERGTVWSLSTSSVTGVSVVGVGAPECEGWFRAAYDPAEIARLLQRQADTNSQTARTAGNSATCRTYQFIYGSTTPIPPGQSIAVTMDFVQDVSETTSGPSPKFFQMSTEFVVGVDATDTKKAYSLQNLIFDRVSMPLF